MKKFVCVLLLSLMLLGSIPVSAASATVDGVTVENADFYARFKGQDITLNVYNWGEYISDGSDDAPDVIAVFEELTGIDVNYTNFGSNEEMYAKIKSGGAQYDIIVPSDYMIGRMIQEGMLEKLDMKNIPLYKNIAEEYRGLEYDPNDEYSVPYLWGLVGILCNTTMVDVEEVYDWNILWDERFMGSILMFSNSRDAFGVSCLRLGYSLNTTDEEELAEAAEELRKQKALVQAYVQDEIYNKMLGGEAALAPYYAGDAILMMAENEDLAFVYPHAGTNSFVDAMVIPKGSKNKEAAEAFINFMCELDVAVANTIYTGAASPIHAVEEMVELDDEIRAIMYPDAEIVENSEVYTALPESTGRLMDTYWTEILSYNENANMWVGPLFLILCFGGSAFITVYRTVKKKRLKEMM